MTKTSPNPCAEVVLPKNVMGGMKCQKDLEQARYNLALAKDACRLNVNRLACFGNYEWTCTAHKGVDYPCWEFCRETDGEAVLGSIVVICEL